MKEYVRTIIDYPVKGIKFRDITTLLQDSEHFTKVINEMTEPWNCLLYTSPSPRDGLLSRMPSSA